MRQLEFIPRLGPWFMTYGHDDPPCCTGVSLGFTRGGLLATAARRGRTGVVFGFRWFPENLADREWVVELPRERHEGSVGTTSA